MMEGKENDNTKEKRRGEYQDTKEPLPITDDQL